MSLRARFFSAMVLRWLPWAVAGSILAVVLIGSSRVALHDHTPQDVLVGLVIGGNLVCNSPICIL